MTTNRKNPIAPFAAALVASLLPVAPAAAQQDAEVIERLRRDQDEVLRKAERLQALMQRLKTRYEREGKDEQVQFLQEGLAHLERSGILRDVASIREDLQTTAFTEALRKQREVVTELERLLNILLARKSIENLDDEIQQVEQRARTASELERRQRELIEQRRDAMRDELSEAEQQLTDELARLRDEQLREADRNAQQAGARRPFLESALERVERLLAGQQQLEKGLADEAAGRTPEAQRTSFDLGDLTQKVREFQRDLRDQQKQRELRDVGAELGGAAEGDDPQALQRARDRLDRLLENPPMAPDPSGGALRSNDEEWQTLRQESFAAPDSDSDAGRQKMREIGDQAREVGERRGDEARKINEQRGEGLSQAADDLAARMQQAAPAPGEQQPAGERAADAMQTAADKLREAQQAAAEGDAEAAQQKVNEALGALDKARSRHRAENPDAARNASEMAAEARAAAQELANAPTQESAERKAGDELREAADALRDVADQVQQARNDGQRTAAEQPTTQSRQSLEAARDALQQALQSSAESNQAELQAAQERQQQLAQQTEQAKQQMQQAAQRGDIGEQQQKAAEAQLDKARQAMEQAAQKLQSGQQASAAQAQQKAAEAMQQAKDALEQNRQMTGEQRQQLKDQAQQQEQLTEDIIRLAQQLEDSNNKDAERAVQQAAEASQKAQRAMDRGDNQEAERQQEEARDKLEEAAEALEQEKDRYQDLRQEELLFRMLEELTTFLEKQRPITEATREFAKANDEGRLSRPARRKVNGLGEEESGLAGKVEFLVSALTDEGNLVYRTVLTANLEDLREVARRLAGRSPDVGSFTVLLQEDVERRTEQMLAALERERKRREQERQDRQQQDQQQQQGENKFSQQREKLVSLIAELEMLRNLEQDTARAAEDLKTLVEVRGDDTISDAEVAMIQRLAHRHNEITKLFAQIKAGVEQALQQGEGGHDDEGGN